MIKSYFSTRLLNAWISAFLVGFREAFLPLFPIFPGSGGSGSNFVRESVRITGLLYSAMSFCILCCFVSVSPVAERLKAGTVSSSSCSTNFSLSSFAKWLLDLSSAEFVRNIRMSCLSTAPLLLLTKQSSALCPLR